MLDLREMSPEELRHLASAAAAQSDLAGSERVLREIVRRSPRDAGALAELARVLHAQQASTEAVAVARRAVAAAPRDGRGHALLASLLAQRGWFDQAARSFESALRLSHIQDDVLTSYAVVLERLRRIDEAKACVERALRLRPDSTPALTLLGHLTAASGDGEAAETYYKRALLNPDDAASCATTWHRIGELRESQERWDDAFEAHARANSLSARAVPQRLFDAPLVFPHLDHVSAKHVAPTLKKWHAHTPNDRYPAPVFLVGFPRSGTTLTEQVLGAIPGAVTSDEEPVLQSARALALRLTGNPNPDELVEAYDSLTDEQIEQVRAEYWTNVQRMVSPDAHRAPVFVDKQPLRFVYAALLNRIFPGSRIIFILRDPRDVCVSCFFQDFEPAGPMALSTTLTGIGDLYAEVMTYWLRMRERLTIPVLEIRYEDMVVDFEAHARRLVEFVGHKWTDDILRFQSQAASRAIRTPSYRAVTSTVTSRAVGKWKRYRAHLDPLMERIAPLLPKLGYDDDPSGDA